MHHHNPLLQRGLVPHLRVGLGFAGKGFAGIHAKTVLRPVGVKGMVVLPNKAFWTTNQ